MRKTIFCILISLVFTANAFAANWYVMNAYRSKDNDYIVSVTKVKEEKDLEEHLKQFS